MLHHTGQTRKFRHDVSLAIVLSANAGFVNAAGWLGFGVLTTNVTGHAALLAVDVARSHWQDALVVGGWLLLFLAGAFATGMWLSLSKGKAAGVYYIPLLAAALILVAVAHFSEGALSTAVMRVCTGSLLFSMGMQNALVSAISGFAVRTTHLTGLVTDLGIDLSKAISSYRTLEREDKLRIALRLSIIVCFLTGGILGGICFERFSFASFYIPALLLGGTVAIDRVQSSKE